MPEGLDTEAALDLLHAYATLLADYQDCFDFQRAVEEEHPRLQKIYSELQRREGQTSDLVDAVHGTVIGFPSIDHRTVADQSRIVQQAIGALETRDETARIIGESSIRIHTGDLHPPVWSAARPHWNADLWGSAVEAAAKAINSQLKAASERRDLSNTDLVRNSLSKNPVDERNPVRLRVHKDDGTDTYVSIQEGTMHMGEAVFMLWRNFESHEETDTSREEAIEALAAMSHFARLVERAELIRFEPDKEAS